MILSTNQELRLHLPSNAVDDVAILQGILDNSEKDFLKDKLGAPLYVRLCEYYNGISPDEFFLSVTNGTYTQDAWAELLLNAQRMVANDAMARFAYQQIISVNGAGINVASSEDYNAASEKLLDKGVHGYRKEAMVSLNNLLLLLEDWAQTANTPMPVAEEDDDTQEGDITTLTDPQTVIGEIVSLWQESKYYYLHHDLLIPTCACLQQFIDIYENRDKFIRLLPDLHFIQDEYITDAIGEETLHDLLQSEDKADKRLLRKVRRMMVAYLEERTMVLSIDRVRRQQAHDEAVALKDSVLAMLKAKEESAQEPGTTTEAQPTGEQGFKNNQPGSRIFVSPLLY